MTTNKLHTLLKRLLEENPYLAEMASKSETAGGFRLAVRTWINAYAEHRPHLLNCYGNGEISRQDFDALDWKDVAALRIIDYLDNAGIKVQDPNISKSFVVSDPFGQLFDAIKGRMPEIKADFLMDMLMLFRQYNGLLEKSVPEKDKVMGWISRHPSGLDPEIVAIRNSNRDRIISKFIEMMDAGRIKDAKFQFEPGMSYHEKFSLMLKWWQTRLFHLRFAIRDPEVLIEMVDGSLSEKRKKQLFRAREAGIPTFVNPYYLSLLMVNPEKHLKGSDEAIREYIFYSKELVDVFGNIVAWEKEDIVEPGKPNAAGWILPSSHSLHRRYPEVAILIPNNMGRACAGLCSSCQRMYDFQRGNLNFDLNRLKPKASWPERLQQFMDYFRYDSQLRDILITGGDALMASDKSLHDVLDAVYTMAVNKVRDNRDRPDGEKFAEMRRIRLGTRLLAYLPQRITQDLAEVLESFRMKALEIGMTQFVIQTHFESALEITPETKKAVERLQSAGWIVTNQLVFTAGASKRGHTNKLRQVLNDIGVLPYYTFSVKGFKENSANFATNERAVQEQMQEKAHGTLPDEYLDEIRNIGLNAGRSIEILARIRTKTGLPFLALDRNVLNLPGVGKSLTFRTIGITPGGKRVLLFDHDQTRRHSPIIEKMGKVTIVESKSVMKYIQQMEEMGEKASEYESVYGYSVSQTEKVMPVYQYPDYHFNVTGEMTNLEV
ncbi:MAG: KamA family protein [Bacteroidales bacterium]|nr:KamA family protein [Bacteroidales bacterium]